MEASEGVGRVEGPADAPSGGSGWQAAPGSGWSRDELDALVAVGVRVVDADEAPGVDEESVRWLDELDHPEHGPVAWLGERAPSGALLSDLESWAADVAVSDYDGVEVVALWHRLEAYCAAGKRRAAAELARRDALAGGLAHLEGRDILVGEVSIAADELALRIGVTKPAARRLVRSGQGMAGAGLLVGEALERGEIDAVKADVILEAIDDLGADAALAVQERVLARAGHLSAGGVRRELAAACAAVEPAEFEDRCERAAASRRVDRPRVLPNGMASLYAVLPAVEATQVYRAVDAAARSGKAAGDLRTMDQLRADALAAMGTAALQTGWIGPAPCNPDRAGAGADEGPFRTGAIRVGVIGGRSARVRVVVPFTMLMDADRPPGTAPPPAAGASGASPPRVGPGPSPPKDGGSEPPGRSLGAAATGGLPSMESVPDLLTIALLEGYGPIPASVARALAAGNPWSRLVLNPVDRTVLELSKATHEPPQSMVDLVTAAQPRCAGPGCEVGADSCDIHHRIPWPVGATEPGNLDPDCRRDHLLLTHGGWAYQQDETDRSRTWTTSTGHRYTVTLDGEIRLLPRAIRPDDPPPF